MSDDKPATERHTESSIFLRIKAKYGRDHAVLRGVRNAASFDADRTCDALAMGIWKSSGIYLHGFEIKVGRSDWLREIQDPAKAEAFAQHCHFWWIAAAPGIVKLEELPAMWGLLEAVGDGLKVRRPATKRDPERIGWSMLAALLRRSTEQSVDAEVLREQFDKGYESGKVAGGNDAQWLRRDFKELSERVEKFERESGVKIDRWERGDIGPAVRLVVKVIQEQRTLAHSAKSIKGSAESLARVADEALAAMAALVGSARQDEEAA